MNIFTSNFLRGFKHILPLLVCILLLGPVPAASADPLACNKRPAKPQIETLFQNQVVDRRRVALGWKTTDCATRYHIEVRQGTTWGRPQDANYDLTDTRYRTRRLERGRTYWWHVEACNQHGCKVSKWASFSIVK
ncbi:MAG: hypothetical protein IT331_17415 [Anaerolineae bacterium]|nr:hypothetical protein [Anaerolineae bacterium]